MEVVGLIILLDVPVSVHGAGIVPVTGPGALAVDCAGVREVSAAGQGAGEAAVGARRVVADPLIGSCPAPGNEREEL